MASKVKITVSVDEALIRELEGASRQKRKPRSQLAALLWGESAGNLPARRQGTCHQSVTLEGGEGR